jgi:hypothetical protein
MRPTPTAPITALSLALLAACAAPPPVTNTPPGPTLPPASEDTCGAATYASHIGGNYRAFPPAPAGRTFRIVCTTCAMTEDFSAQRLNVLYDEASGRVVRLTCG